MRADQDEATGGPKEAQAPGAQDHDATEHAVFGRTSEGDLILARLMPSPARRVIGAVILFSLGLFVLYLALWQAPEGLLLRLFLLIFALSVLFGCLRLWQATERGLELTPRELRETGGRRLALVAQMQDASRGAFAFKPSNGFMVRLDAPGATVWAPGLWWRLGRRLGVGGVTSASEARFMAEQINTLIAARAQSRTEQD
ncbi:hypothetical protein [Szabonella alba]|uniref:Uncharacterized protein n=1 Tax=Szabonella alba TaxID=2804194 RepID=A0A8K0Y1H4_9RHOB|nr:hypothetical protein [Szabonella alba]MBL4916024.1 hypothetical protein [Szabonella alba]